MAEGNGQAWTTAYRAIIGLGVTVIIGMTGLIWSNQTSAIDKVAQSVKDVAGEVKEIGRQVGIIAGDLKTETKLREQLDDQHSRSIDALWHQRRSDLQP